MKLILVRHGHDMQGSDGESCLSWQGQKQARDLADKLRAAGIDAIDVARCSPSRRTRETLQQLASAIRIGDQDTALELAPDRDVAALNTLVWRRWSDEPQCLLFVGHEPQLSNSVLRWCGLPENDPSNTQSPPWILARGEALILRPSFERTQIRLDSSCLTFVGRDRPLPIPQPTTRAGAFGSH
jgi:phosphohistidine phosphatase SixA